MRFSLLTPPTDAPSRIPLSRGLPSASALQVETGYLPRALPLPAMDVEASAAPYQALARFAATGGQVSSDVTTLIVAAEAKKREVNNTTESESLYTEMAQAVDADLNQLRVTETDQTLRPAFNAMWATKRDAYLQRASNPQVQLELQGKLNKLVLAKSAEVSDATRTKFVNRQAADLHQNVTRLTRMATDPSLPEFTQQLHQAELESTLLKASHSGLHNPEHITKLWEESLNTIQIERVQMKALTNPLQVMQGFATGEDYGLSGKQQRQVMEYATQQLRIQRSDLAHADAEKQRALKAQQDTTTMGIRRQITENWDSAGPKQSMLATINAAAPELGDDNYKSLLETERTYQDRATRPGPKKQSDRETVGRLQTLFTTGRWHEVSQGDLLQLLKSEQLDEADHRYFSNMRDQKSKDASTAKPETETEKAYKAELKRSETLIETFIKRGSKYEAQSSEIIAQDAVMELYRRAGENPKLRPEAIANELIAQKIAQHESLVEGLPYQSKEAVLAAWKKGLLSKEEATRYTLIFDLIEKNKPAPKTSTTPTPGFWQRTFPEFYPKAPAAGPQAPAAGPGEEFLPVRPKGKR